jgi:hypothetical protein
MITVRTKFLARLERGVAYRRARLVLDIFIPWVCGLYYRRSWVGLLAKKAMKAGGDIGP